MSLLNTEDVTAFYHYENASKNSVYVQFQSTVGQISITWRLEINHKASFECLERE